MGKTIETEIVGKRYLLNSDDSEDYIRQLSDIVTEKITEIKDQSGASPLACATMAALSFADELIKEREKIKNPRRGINQ